MGAIWFFLCGIRQVTTLAEARIVNSYHALTISCIISLSRTKTQPKKTKSISCPYPQIIPIIKESVNMTNDRWKMMKGLMFCFVVLKKSLLFYSLKRLPNFLFVLFIKVGAVLVLASMCLSLYASCISASFFSCCSRWAAILAAAAAAAACSCCACWMASCSARFFAAASSWAARAAWRSSSNLSR